MRSLFRSHTGFTLLELLVVVSILAAVALVASGAYWHVNDDVNEQLVHAEMQEIAAAIKRFKQDTGYYPKEGPFNLQVNGGAIDYDDLPNWAGNPNEAVNATEDQKRRWFESPANFYQLLTNESPLEKSENTLREWNPETGRGWRGPYLQGFRDGYVDISAEINGKDYTHWHDSDPAVITSTGHGVTDVPGLADPFEAKYEIENDDDVDGTVLDWSNIRRRAQGEDSEINRNIHEYWGRPYLFFQGVEVDGSGPYDFSGTRSFLISFGPNGNYDAGINNAGRKDDILLLIE